MPNKNEVFDSKTVERVNNVAEKFSKLPPEAQRYIANMLEGMTKMYEVLQKGA